MAKVKITSTLFQTNYKAIRDLAPELLKIAGEEGIRSIKGQTRSGYELIQNGDKKSQTALKSSTINRRERLSTVNKTHGAYRANLSNLTFTGQLLNAVQYVISGFKVTFSVKDSQRRPYKNITNRKSKNSSTPTNQQVAQYLSQQGRNFIALDRSTLQIINNKMLGLLRRTLKKLI